MSLFLSHLLLPHPPSPVIIVKVPLLKVGDGLGPGAVLSLPCQSHHILGLINLTYNQLGPVPDIVPLPLGLPQALPNIFSLPQQGIEPPFYLHGCLFLIPMDILLIPICA